MKKKRKPARKTRKAIPTRESQIKAIQKIVFPGAPAEWDGVFGPKSKAALDRLIRGDKLLGDGSWPWIKASVDGDDIVIEPGKVTAFGGADDKCDSGETASGVSTKLNPDIVGCALPMRRDASPALKGSPIPKLPWQTKVVFAAPSGQEITAVLLDEGPAKWTKNIGDLTVAAARKFDQNATANSFGRTLSIRIIGGAKYAVLILSLAFMFIGCKEGSNFGVTAGFGGAEVGYKYTAPRKPRVKKVTPTPAPVASPTVQPAHLASF
jgi:hypothetical protein